MAKIKRQSVSSVQDKAYWARHAAQTNDYQQSTVDTVMDLNRGKAKGLDRLLGRTPSEGERSAARMMQKTKSAELDRSATRAQGVTNRAAAKAVKEDRRRGLTGRSSGGITGKGSKNVNPTYNTY
jgi:hypothetical protein